MTVFNRANNGAGIWEDHHVAAGKTQSVDGSSTPVDRAGHGAILGAILADQAREDHRAVRRRRPGRCLCPHPGPELQALKQQFIIENRPGAGAIIGTDVVQRRARRLHAADDVQHPHDQRDADPNKPYELMRDLVAVAPVNSSDLVMVVHPSVKARTLKEFLALAKADPGKPLTPRRDPGRPTTWPVSCSKP